GPSPPPTARPRPRPPRRPRTSPTGASRRPGRRSARPAPGWPRPESSPRGCAAAPGRPPRPPPVRAGSGRAPARGRWSRADPVTGRLRPLTELGEEGLDHARQVVRGRHAPEAEARLLRLGAGRVEVDGPDVQQAVERPLRGVDVLDAVDVGRL